MNINLIIKIALISVITYLSAVFIKVPVQFLTLDIKCSLTYLGGVALGGYAGILIALISSLLEGFTISGSGVIGMVMNFFATFFFIIPIVFLKINNFSNTKKIALSIVFGTIFMTIAMIVLNIILTPIYLGVPLKEVWHLLFVLIIPFNIIKGIINGILIILMKKPLEKILQKINHIQ